MNAERCTISERQDQAGEFSKCGYHTSIFSIFWELVKNATSWAPL